MSRVFFHSEQMTYTTARIECAIADDRTSIGTGFFFQFARGADKNIPVLVTNAHVVKGSKSFKLLIRAKNPDGTPNNKDQVLFAMPTPESGWFRHPDSSVDLAILPIAGMLEEMIRQKKHPYYVSLREADLPSAIQLDELGAVEDILMVGYPNGLWDETNNLPIIRAGITATHPAIDYNGKPEFVIDAACFGGSSGSPVFFYNSGMRPQRGGGIAMGAPVALLLGVLYAGPMYTAQGDIVVVDVPTQKVGVASSAIPMNLGYVIKSRCLLDFDRLFPSIIADA
jgi:Trypsin-like peptidase domain